MSLRTINAGYSLVTTLLALAHAISLAIWMLSKGAVPMPPKVLPWVLTIMAGIHAILSVVIMITTHKGQQKKGNSYPKLNRETIVQRITGVLMLLFTALHILGTVGIMQPPQFVHAVVPPLFFFIVLAHTAISTSKALITLGIGSWKFIRVATIAVKLVCATTLIADVVGFYLFVC